MFGDVWGLNSQFVDLKVCCLECFETPIFNRHAWFGSLTKWSLFSFNPSRLGYETNLYKSDKLQLTQVLSSDWWFQATVFEKYESPFCKSSQFFWMDNKVSYVNKTTYHSHLVAIVSFSKSWWTFPVT